MDKYIECKKAIDACFDGWNNNAHDCAENIRSIPAADVRPVVLCRECKSYNRPRLGFCETHLVRMHGNDYCSYGKKREES